MTNAAAGAANQKYPNETRYSATRRGSFVEGWLAHERSAGAAPLDPEDLGWVLYEMGIDDLSLDDARKLAAHIIVRLSARLLRLS